MLGFLIDIRNFVIGLVLTVFQWIFSANVFVLFGILLLLFLLFRIFKK